MEYIEHEKEEVIAIRKLSHMESFQVNDYLSFGNNQKLQNLYILLLIICYSFSGTFFLIAPFFPPLALDRGINQSKIGIILSIEPIGSAITSIFVSQMVVQWGKKRTFLIGMFMLSIGTICFGILQFIYQLDLFFIWAVFFRTLTGIGAAASNVCIFSQISIMFPHEQLNFKLGLAQLSKGFGAASMPLIGSLIYSLTNFMVPFIIMGTLIFCCFISLIFLFPKDNQDDALKNRKINMIKFYQNQEILANCFLVILTATAAGFLMATFANHLKISYKANEIQIGSYFSLAISFYIIPIIFFALLPKNIKHKLYIFLGATLCTLSYFMLGPDSYIFSTNIFIVITGGCLLCFGATFVQVPFMPEIIQIVQTQIYKDERDRVIISDIVSGMFQTMWIIGQILGPFISGYAVDIFGFANSTVYFGFIQFIYLLIYFPLAKCYQLINGITYKSQIIKKETTNYYKSNIQQYEKFENDETIDDITNGKTQIENNQSLQNLQKF